MIHFEGSESTGTYYVHATSLIGSEYLHSRAKAKTPPDLIFARYKVQEQTTGSNRISVTVASWTRFGLNVWFNLGLQRVSKVLWLQAAGTSSREAIRSYIDKNRIIDRRRSQTVRVLHFLKNLVSIHVPKDKSRTKYRSKSKYPPRQGTHSSNHQSGVKILPLSTGPVLEQTKKQSGAKHSITPE